MNDAVLYLGNFSPMTSFAALNRALGICKLFNLNHYDTHITVHNCYDEFRKDTFLKENSVFLHEINFTKKTFYFSSKQYFEIINKIENLKIIVLYNFPYLPSKKILNYCRQKGIKIIGDITEWYDTSNVPFVFKPIKYFDTEKRMEKLNFKLDGLIVVSNRLESFYKGIKNTIKIYPTMDYSICGKKHDILKNKSAIKIAYVGISGKKKDNLEKFAELLSKLRLENVELHIVGKINDDVIKILEKYKINFKYHGYLSHDKAIEILLGCDCQILYREPSRMNNFGFPSKFAESMCLNIPVACTIFSDVLDFASKNCFIINENPEEFKAFLLSVKKESEPIDSKCFYSSYYIESFTQFLKNIIS